MGSSLALESVLLVGGAVSALSAVVAHGANSLIRNRMAKQDARRKGEAVLAELRDMHARFLDKCVRRMSLIDRHDTDPRDSSILAPPTDSSALISIERRDVGRRTLFGGLLGGVVATAFVPKGANAAISRVLPEYDGAKTGIVADNHTDNTAKFQALVTLVGSRGGGRIVLPPGIIRISAAVIVPRNVWIDGVGEESTVIYQTRTDWAFIFNQSNFKLTNLTVKGNSSALGGLYINGYNGTNDGTVGCGMVSHVWVEDFTGANAVAVKLREAYRIGLEYTHIYNNCTGLAFEGNISTFTFRKGEIAVTKRNGYAIYAPPPPNCNIEAFFDNVYQEACAGPTPNFFAAYGYVHFNGCSNEAMCVNGDTSTISNPKIFCVLNPCKFRLSNSYIGGFYTPAKGGQNYAGVLTVIGAGADAPGIVVENVEVVQDYPMPALPAQFLYNQGRISQISLRDVRIGGSGWANLAQAEQFFWRGYRAEYSSQFLSMENCVVAVSGPEGGVSLHNHRPPAFKVVGSVTATAPNTTLVQKTLYGCGHGYRIDVTVKGARTGTAETKKLALTIDDGKNPITVDLTSSVTTATNFVARASLMMNQYNLGALTVERTDDGAATVVTFHKTALDGRFPFVFTINGSANSGDSISIHECHFDRA